MPLSEDDGVLLYTDGILDARDEHGERFGEERLSALVAGTPARPPRAWSSTCGVALADFTPAAGDDVCLLRRATMGRPIGGRRRRR